MVLSNKQNALSLDVANEDIKACLEMIAKMDFNALDFGKMQVSETISYNKVTITNKEFNNQEFEAHKQFVDIHFCLSGSERIDIADVDTLEVSSEYNAEKDVYFLKGINYSTVNLLPGDYCICYPNDAHLPSIKYQGDDIVKVIFKIQVK